MGQREDKGLAGPSVTEARDVQRVKLLRVNVMIVASRAGCAADHNMQCQQRRLVEILALALLLEDVLERRLLGRNQGRVDDNIETIKKRFKVQPPLHVPMIASLRTRGPQPRRTAAEPGSTSGLKLCAAAAARNPVAAAA
eukprot:365315-Chlamydomonas_euryale.AAC.10